MSTQKKYLQTFSKWLLVGTSRYWSSFGAIPIRKKQVNFWRWRHHFSWEDKEWLILYSKRKLEPNITITSFLDTVIYLWKFLLVKNSEYANLGDWITYFTYGVFDGNFEIKKYEVIYWDYSNKYKPVSKFWDSLPTFILNEIMTRFFTRFN
jgi:hypothetical protein